MIFETKKIQLETLSEYLIEIRTELGLTLSEVSEKASMKQKFLEFLEQGEFQKLPADVYVFGFLRQLGTLYAVDCQVLIDQYKKEKNIAQQLQKKSVFNSATPKRMFNKIVITPKYVSFSLGLLFVILTLGYVIWQVGSINKTPTLDISSPQDRQIIKGSIVNVEGKTNPGMSLTINDKSIFVDSSGNFKTQIGADNGPKQLTFVAKNKFEKTATKTLTIIGEIGDVESASTVITSAVQLKLEFSGAVTVNYSIDEGLTQSFSFTSGDTKMLNGREKIVLSVSDAGATKVTYNGDYIGFLGKSGEKLVNIPFVAALQTQATTTP